MKRWDQGNASPMEITSTSAIEHILVNRPRRIKRVIFSRAPSGERMLKIESLARNNQIRVSVDERNPSQEAQVRALVSPFEYVVWKDFLAKAEKSETSFIVALDHLQDPQNFGAICRSAEGFGIHGVLIPKDRSVTVSPGVYHASVGAVETLNIVLITNLADSLRQLKEAGYWIVGTGLNVNGYTPWGLPDFEKMVLVLGTEFKGMSRGLEKICDCWVEIPMKGKVQSLNVSATGAVLMYEWFKRHAPKEHPEPQPRKN